MPRKYNKEDYKFYIKTILLNKGIVIKSYSKATKRKVIDLADKNNIPYDRDTLDLFYKNYKKEALAKHQLYVVLKKMISDKRIRDFYKYAKHYNWWDTEWKNFANMIHHYDNHEILTLGPFKVRIGNNIHLLEPYAYHSFLDKIKR